MDKDNGECNYEKRSLFIHPKLEGKKRLEITIHEALHALYPDLTEAVVKRGAFDLARLLWRLGYGP